jgi:hypothetical protein
MKKLLFCLSLFTLISCEKYVTEISTITLSGKYLLQKVSIVQIENPTDSMRNFDVGGMVINRFLPDPFDSLKIGGFYMYFNYSSLRMNLLPRRQNDSRDIWEYGMPPDDIFYHRVPYSFDAYTFGKIYFEYKPKGENSIRKIILNIDSDLTESLQLSGLDFSPFGKDGPKYRYILHLKRT